MKVFKFGGASVKDADSVRNVADIISRQNDNKLLVVISAMGKTTNALEAVIKPLYADNKAQSHEALASVKQKHIEAINQLFNKNDQVIAKVNELILDIETFINNSKSNNYDKDYDRIVSLGELLSTTIVSAYLEESGQKAVWLDVRDVIKTDDSYREGKIQWKVTSSLIQKKVASLFETHDLIITQGFLGSTETGETTTLGREGSDFTASIFSYALDAASMSIWKDVPGILTGDPRIFSNLTKIDRLSYKEAIEMTYYGAKVIHPKTIKPIQNKGIPLYVKSFIDPSGSGTLITDQVELSYPPVIVIEHDQVLIHVSTKDFSFVAEHHLSKLFQILSDMRIKVNMMRNSAISFTICTQNDEAKLEQLHLAIGNEFKVIVDKDLELVTIRHYNQETVDELKKGKIVLHEERLRDTLQMVMKEIPIVQRK